MNNTSINELYKCNYFLEKPEACFPLKIGLMLYSSLNLNTLLNNIMEITTQFMEVEASSLLLYDSNNNSLTFKISLGPQGMKLFNTKLSADKGIVGLSISQKKSIVVNDVTHSEYFNPEIDKKIGFTTKNILCTPLLSHDKVIGAIELINKKNNRQFNENDIKIIEALANQIAISLENANLFEKIKNEATQKELLYKFSTQIANSFNIQEIINACENLLNTIYKFDNLVLGTFDSELKNTIYYIKNKNIDQDIIQNILSDKNAIYNEQKINLDKKFLIYFPIKQGKDKLLGFMIFSSSQVETTSKENIAFLYNIQNLLSITLEKIEFLNKQIEEERLKKTLQLGQEIQNNLLPNNYFEDQNIEMYAYYKPCLTISGDYYDFINLNENEYFFLIADASGKGVSAAMMMADTRTLIHLLLEEGKDIKYIIKKINKTISNIGQGSFFITAFFGIINIKAYELSYINCGHNYPFLCYKQNIIELEGNNMPIGILNEIEPVVKTLKINKNSKIFCYTDGVIDAKHQEGFSFGETRLYEFIKSSQTNNNTKENILNLKNILEEFTQNSIQQDDITFMSIKIK